MYRIEYHTGAGNIVRIRTLERAKELADEGAEYTQKSISIYDDDDNEVARRSWYGCTSGIEDCEDPIQFGDYGFYDDWSGE